MKKRVLIIGAGIAGLTAGIYAQRSGFDATILEQHTIPGGMCTGWRRKGYFFDGAMHWLTGSSPKTQLHTLWTEVGALSDGVKVRYDEPFRSVEWEGKTVYLYREPHKMQAHFNALSPQDAAATRQLVADVQAFTKMEMPITDVKGVKAAHPRKMSAAAALKMLPLLPKMGKLGKLSTTEYISRFSHPALRMLLNSVIPDEEYSATSLLFTLATLAVGDGGYPEGGSPAMAKRMADTFTGLGGSIQYGTKADRVVVENGKATGISVNGTTMLADAVIVTQETLAAAQQLFDAPPRDEWLINLKRDTRPAACTFVCIGVRAVLKETPLFTLPQPIICAGRSYAELGFNNYSDYPAYSPEGGTALTVFLGGDSYDYWKQARDEGRYEAEKEALAQQVIRALCQKHPQAEGNIEVTDVATPLTYERYTGASRGSWMSVMGKGDTAALNTHCTLDGVDGLYFAGHRVMKPGGMPSALLTGRTAAQMVCRQFDAVFD